MYNQVSSQFDNGCRSDNFFYRIINGYQKYGVFPEDFLLIFLYFRLVSHSQVGRGFLNNYIVPSALLTFGVDRGAKDPIWKTFSALPTALLFPYPIL